MPRPVPGRPYQPWRFRLKGTPAPADASTPAHGWLQIQLVRRPRTIGTIVQYRLCPPTVVTPPAGEEIVVIAPLGALAYQQQRRETKSALRPPQVVDQPTQPPVVTTLRVTLAEQQARRETKSTLRPPTAVDQPTQPPVSATLEVRLAKAQRTNRGQGYGLSAPITVDLPAVPPLDVRLARQQPRRPIKSELGRPQVVGTTPSAAPVDAKVKVTLARPRLRPRAISALGTPTVVSAPVVVPPGGPPTLEQQTIRVQLVAVPRAATVRAHWTLRRPTVLCICPVLVPVVPGSLTLNPYATGTLTLAAATAGSLTLAAATPGELTLNPYGPGTLTLDPAPEDCC